MTQNTENNTIKKIKKGDKVYIRSGKDRGQQGEVKRIIRSKGKVIVAGINKVKKHIKAQGKDKPGGIIEREAPMAVSKLMVVCPTCKKPVRVGFQIDSQKKKQRICKKCQGLIDGGK